MTASQCVETMSAGQASHCSTRASTQPFEAAYGEFVGIHESNLVFARKSGCGFGPTFESIDGPPGEFEVRHAPEHLADDFFLDDPGPPMLALHQHLFASFRGDQIDAAVRVRAAFPLDFEAIGTQRRVGETGSCQESGHNCPREDGSSHRLKANL